MEITTLTAARGLALGRSWRVRVAVAAAFALILTWFVLAQQPAHAQIDVRQFVCPTLIAIRNAFASSPFFSFVAAAINPILSAFGCGVS